MARRRKRNKAAGISLDSMLDIVTNSLGLLILVATLTAFSSEGIKVTLGAPVMTEADETKTVVRFELNDDNVYPIDIDSWLMSFGRTWIPASTTSPE